MHRRERTAFSIECPIFRDGEPIPRKYTCDGEEISPPLRWKGAPAGTKSFVLICDDPDAPMMTWIHWIVYSIPGTTTELSEGLPAGDVVDGGIKQGLNSWRKMGYGGPCPPRRNRHRYFFRLFALDTELSLSPGETRHDIERAMKGHILDQTKIMGVYGT